MPIQLSEASKDQQTQNALDMLEHRGELTDEDFERHVKDPTYLSRRRKQTTPPTQEANPWTEIVEKHAEDYRTEKELKWKQLGVSASSSTHTRPYSWQSSSSWWHSAASSWGPWGSSNSWYGSSWWYNKSDWTIKADDESPEQWPWSKQGPIEEE